MNFVLDTNIVIYLQKGLLAEPLPEGAYFLSVITEIELLSFPGLTPDQKQVLHELLSDVTVVGIDDSVKQETIRLRRDSRLRLPDAIVAATAVAVSAELLTNDARLVGMPGLSARPVRLRQ